MVQRIAECVGYGLGPLLELLPVGGVLTCAVLLFYSIGTHGAPLVVVATQPQLGDRLKAVVVGHHLRDKVTMIVDNGHLGRMIVIEVLSQRGLENEVIIIEFLHTFVGLNAFKFKFSAKLGIISQKSANFAQNNHVNVCYNYAQ